MMPTAMPSGTLRAQCEIRTGVPEDRNAKCMGHKWVDLNDKDLAAGIEDCKDRFNDAEQHPYRHTSKHKNYEINSPSVEPPCRHRDVKIILAIQAGRYKPIGM